MEGLELLESVPWLPADHLWAYPALLALVAIEGEVAILLGAGAASAGFLDPLPVLIASVFGNLFSDVGWYALGYYGRLDWLLRRARWFGVTSRRLDVLKRLIDRDATRLLLFAKVSNWLAIPALIATGMARVPWRRWFLLILLSDVVVAIVFVSLGYFTTASFLQVEKGMGYLALGLTLLLLVAATFAVRRHLSRRDPTSEMTE